MSSLLIKPPPDSDASSLLPLVTQAEHDDDNDDEDASLVLLENGETSVGQDGVRTRDRTSLGLGSTSRAQTRERHLTRFSIKPLSADNYRLFPIIDKNPDNFQKIIGMSQKIQ